jgi:succinyl-CoA synthetase alpha subunit
LVLTARALSLPMKAKIGIMPGFIFKKGNVGVVSKSGTLTYEAVDQVVKAGLGITTAIGIGGDPIIGTPTKEAVELLMNDPRYTWYHHDWRNWWWHGS